MTTKRAKFGDVVTKVNDTVDPFVAGLDRYVAGEHMVTDDPILRDFGTVGDGYLGPAFKMRFRPGQILYGSRRTYLRKVAKATFEGVCANTTFVLQSSTKELLDEFLLLVMCSERFHSFSILNSKGSTNPYINFSDLTNYEFELPSIEEQHRIVEMMTAVDEHIESLRHQLDVLQTTRKSVLHHLLNAGGKGWTTTTLGNVAEVSMGRQLSPSKRLGVRPRPYLRAANIGPNGIDLEDVLEMDFTQNEEKMFSNQIGDVLLVEGGNEKSVGCPAIVTEREIGLCIQNTILRCRVRDQTQLSPDFLYQYMRHSFTSGKFAELCAGTTIMHLGQKRAVVFPISLPPLDEQQRIVHEVSKIDGLIQDSNSALAATQQLRSALLNKEIS
jgi:type I restriction enzyme S subunit